LKQAGPPGTLDHLSHSPRPSAGRAEIQVELRLPDGADAEELDAATARLRDELLDLDVERVERVRGGEAPPGARSGELAALGELLLVLARNTETISSVLGSLRAWLGRDHGRSVRLVIDGDSLEVTGISSREQERLIETFVARHGSAAP
jgi:hypothetical protein